MLEDKDMIIVDFTEDHIEEATRLICQSYEEEQGFVPALPQIKKLQF